MVSFNSEARLLSLNIKKTTQNCLKLLEISGHPPEYGVYTDIVI